MGNIVEQNQYDANVALIEDNDPLTGEASGGILNRAAKALANRTKWLRAALLAHIDNTNNPHGTTAALVGAATVDHTHNNGAGIGGPYALPLAIRTQVINHAGHGPANDAVVTTHAKALISGTFGIINGTNDVMGWKVTVKSDFSDGTSSTTTVFDSGQTAVNYVVAMNPVFSYAPPKPGTHTFTITLYGANTTFFDFNNMAGMFSIIES